MTTLKVIGEGDRLADSRQDINENFASLDEGKVEKTDVTASPTADTIPCRTNAGDINMRLPRSTYVNDSRINSSAAVVMRNSNSGDNYHRSVTKDAFKMWFESLHGLGDANLPNKEPNNQDMYTHFFVVGKSNPNSPFNQNSVILQLLRIPPTHAVQLAFDCLGQCYTRETSDGGMTWNSWVSGTTAFRVDSKGNGHDIVKINGGSFMKQVSERGAVAIGRDDSIIIQSGDKRDEVVENVTETGEQLHLGADTTVYIRTALQDGWVARKEFVFGKDGSLALPHALKVENCTLSQGRPEGPLRVTTPHGYIDVGPYNSSYAHIHTDRPKFHFDKPMYVNGDIFAGKGYDKKVELLETDSSGVNPQSDQWYTIATKKTRAYGKFTIVDRSNTRRGMTFYAHSMFTAGPHAISVIGAAGSGLPINYIRIMHNEDTNEQELQVQARYDSNAPWTVILSENYFEDGDDGWALVSLRPIDSGGTVMGSTLATNDADTAMAVSGKIFAEHNKKVLVQDDPVSTLSQDSTHRFVTDTEKASWNGKLGSTSTAANALKWGGANKTVSTAAPSGGADGDIWFQYL